MVKEGIPRAPHQRGGNTDTDFHWGTGDPTVVSLEALLGPGRFERGLLEAHHGVQLSSIPENLARRT